MQVSSTLFGRFEARSSMSRTATFPDFLPREVEKIRDTSAREMAKRIQRLPVQVAGGKFSLVLHFLCVFFCCINCPSRIRLASLIS